MNPAMMKFIRFLRIVLAYTVLCPTREAAGVLRENKRFWFLIPLALIILFASTTLSGFAVSHIANIRTRSMDCAGVVGPVGVREIATEKEDSCVQRSNLPVFTLAAAFTGGTTLIGAILLSLPVFLFAVYSFSLGAVRGAWLTLRAAAVPALKSWVPPVFDGNVIACQISDLHLTAENHVPHEIEESSVIWEGPHVPDENRLRASFRRVMQSALAEKPAALLFTGDLTDTGRRAEWAVFTETMSEVKTDARVIVVPGNHDLSLNGRDDPDYGLRRRSQRESEFSAACGSYLPGENLESFPWVAHLPAEDADGVYVLSLNSVTRPSDNILSNAANSWRRLKTFSTESAGRCSS